ncbi:MAG TPA: hypothetical protein VE775_12530 [Pyrinomonadaceae bacterium]|jgi:hypothetical protein|nr:hypothetical protein [Pyrinomonadaceae bacterium]
MERQVPQKLLEQLAKWHTQTRVLRISHALLVMLATICSVLVAARLSPFNYVPVEWMAALAAISISLINALNLGFKSNQMRKAWRSLNAAIIWFEEDASVPVQHLIDVYKEGEEIIGDVKEAP